MTRAGALLDLAREIERKHERSPKDRITVVPVIVDDLEETLPVLEAVAAVCHGRLFVALHSEISKQVPSTNDPIRRAAITQAMQGDAASPRYARLVNLSDGTLDAEFTNPASEVPSPGERTVLGVIRATMHQDFDDHELVIVAYKETLLDSIFRQRVWSLAVDHLADMDHRNLRTVVFVAEAAIDVGMHCKAGRGFQLAVDGGRLLRRHGRYDLEVQAARFADDADKEAIVIFLGAGFSASSRMPLGNQVRDGAIRRILDLRATEPFSSLTLAKRFHVWAADRGLLTQAEAQLEPDVYAQRLTLEQVIRIEHAMHRDLPTLKDFKRHHDDVVDAPGDAVIDLAAILDMAVGRAVIVEVNFDTLIETHSRVPLRVFATKDEFAAAASYIERYLARQEQAIPLLKLHGTIENPESCVVSIDQTERGLGPEKVEALHALRASPSESPRRWVYVGASLRDLDLGPLLRSEEFGRGLDEWWVSPYLVESVEEFAQARVGFWRDSQFRSIDDRMITENADAFFHALRVAWQARFGGQ